MLKFQFLLQIIMRLLSSHYVKFFNANILPIHYLHCIHYFKNAILLGYTNTNRFCLIGMFVPTLFLSSVSLLLPSYINLIQDNYLNIIWLIK